MLVDSTGTFPNVTAVGLTLSVLEGVVLEFGGVSAPEAVVAAFVVDAELPLALVTPVHPDWVMAANNIVANTMRESADKILGRCDVIGAWVPC